MKRLALLALFPFAASAAPFVVGDLPDQSTTHCILEFDGTWGQDAPATGTPKICKFDVSTVTRGQQHTVRMKAVRIDAVQGREESAPSAPFSFTLLAPPAAPSTPRLTAQ